MPVVISKRTMVNLMRGSTAIFSLICVFSFSANVEGQDGRKIGEIHIGETVPSLVTSHILNYSSATVDLSALKGKVIILDFGTTGCVPCMRLFPELDSLQRLFGDKVQIFFVTPEKTERVAGWLQKSPIAKNTVLPVVTADTTLTKQFKHEFFPHEVWINAQGVVVAQTESDYVTATNIRTVLDGREVHWARKHEESYDYQRPLFGLNENNIPQGSDHKDNRIYYSSFTQYLDGIPPGESEDSSISARRVSFINQTIVEMYLMTYQQNRNSFPWSRILFETKDTSGLDFDRINEYLTIWDQKHRFCYETSVPAGLPRQQREERIREDLNVYLNMRGRMENRPTKCLAVVRLPGYEKKSLTDNGFADIKHRQRSDLSIPNLIWSLNRIHGMPPVFDRTGYLKDEADRYFAKDISLSVDMMGLKKELNGHGLDIVPIEEKLDMLVLSDR